MMQNRAESIQIVPIDQIKPNPKNRNKHSEEQIERLAKIIEYQGFRIPLVVSNRSGLLVAGHGRLLAAKKLGFFQLPVTFQDFESEEQEYAAQVSDNAISSWAELDLSGIHLDLPELEPFDLDLLGIKNFELEPTPLTGDPDETPEPPKEAKTTLGELWLLGPHKLLIGDCTDPQNITRLMGDVRADMIWTDPPYNVAYEGSDGKKIQNDDMSDESFFQFLSTAFFNMFSFTKAGGSFYVAHADSEGLNFRKAIKEAGFETKQCIIWNKSSLVMGRQDYQWKHEPILYGWKPGAAHNWYSDRKQTTVIDFDKPRKNGEHPTMKPVGLIEYFLENSSKPGDVVMDLFLGSGSTLMACEQQKRKCVGTELDPVYADVIVQRWEKFTGQKAKREDGKLFEEL